MSELWREWAKTALRKMDDPDWKIRDRDRGWRGGEGGARVALRDVTEKGYEPYYTLKAFVCLNGLERKEETG